MSITNKLIKLQERRTDNSVLRKSVLESCSTASLESSVEMFSNSGLSETEEYVLTSMKEVESQYTKKSFTEATVDSTGSKSVCIKGGSLSRKIDAVPCNWFNTAIYTLTRNKIYRGINILDSKREIRIKNLPFLHNYMLEIKDKNTKGIFKQLVRLVKSIKSDMDIVPDISSYEITALLYHMDNNSINCCKATKSILGNIYSHFISLYNNSAILKTLKVPNGTSYIMASLKRSEFHKLIDEIYSMYLEV